MKKSVKTIITVVSVIAIIAVVSVSAYFVTLKLEENKVLVIIDKTYSNFKNGNFTDVINTNKLNENEINDLKNNEILKNVLEGLKYEVKEKKVNFKEAKVQLAVTNKDFKTLFGKVMQKSFSIAISSGFSGKEISDEEMNNIMAGYIKDLLATDEIKEITTNIEVELVKENKEWKLKTSEDKIMNAVLPGYTDIKTSLDALNSNN